MAGTTPERDWKYMKKIKDDLLAGLCGRINKQSSVILAETGVSEHEKNRGHPLKGISKSFSGQVYY